MENTLPVLKKCPIGISSFQDIIEKNLLYVDKTRHIHNLVTEGKNYFLSRPRRFGKSLLLSSLKSLFSGPPDPNGPPAGLFQNLWIDKPGFIFPERHPIISLSMASHGATNETLNVSLLNILNKINTNENLGLAISVPGADFSILIESLFNKYNKKVVVLIDEYDEPVSANLHNLTLAEENKETLKDFYSGLKTADEFTRLVFVTGVTRYAFMGLSAGLNHLDDITLNEKYADICGFTHEELDNYFTAYFPEVLGSLQNDGAFSMTENITNLRDDILSYYDGYTWDGKIKILNPYSLLKFIQTRDFDPHWIILGPSSNFLSSIVANNPLAFLMDKLQNFNLTDISIAEVGSLAPVPALFQTGYLTIDTITRTRKKSIFSFKIPNEEIRPEFETLFRNNLFALLNKDPNEDGITLKKILDSGDASKISELITSLYSSLPAIHHRSEESFYHSLLYSYCWGILEFAPLSEQPGGNGTPDIILFFNDGLYVVIELKYQKPEISKNVETDPEKLKKILENLATLGLKSIEEKKYANAYLSRAKKIIKIGLGVYHRGDSLALIK
ncbi:MAG: ATP-binding protein [Deltaproteobacteria bacterium]|jgi:hypothetical protein|nr:ATP-binding protein [Deltaproteobacteria bacterium]